MQTEFERKQIENELIRRETRSTLWYSLGIILTILIYTAIAYLIHPSGKPSGKIVNAWQISNIIAIVLVAVVLAVRRTIYFSPRLLKGEAKLSLILKKWCSIDRKMLLFGELMGGLGLVLTLLGMPWKHTSHFFVAAILVTMVLMPIPWKVKDKIRYFEKFIGRWNE